MDNMKTVYPPQITLQDIKETKVTKGWTHGQLDNSIPSTNKVCVCVCVCVGGGGIITQHAKS